MFDIIGWIVWAVVLSVAAMLSYGLSQRRTVTRGTLFLILALWIDAAVFLLKPQWNKLHLVWLVVITFLAMTIYSYSLGWRAARSLDAD